MWTAFPHMHNLPERAAPINTNKHILWMPRSCDALFKYICFMLDPFVEWETANCAYLRPLYTHIPHTYVIWSVFKFFFLSSRAHRFTDSCDFNYFAERLRWRWCTGWIKTLIWSGSSSVSTTKLHSYSQQNSLQKRDAGSSVFIPKPWQNCTPPYSWSNYPGPL